MSVDLTTTIATRSGDIVLPNPIIGASGSFGHSNELFDVIDPYEVGAVTIKSLAPFDSPGNPSPRVAAVKTGMMNSVGLPGPHIQEWVEKDFPKIENVAGRFIMAIWGRTFDEFAQAAAILAPIAHNFVAIEANLSCPNTESGDRLFAQSEQDTAEITRRVKKELPDNLPVSIKLTTAVTRPKDIAAAAIDGGADMLTLFNTVLGLAIDPHTRKAILGKGAGGYSGSGVLPIAQKGIYEVHSAFPNTPIIGVGGVMSGEDAASMMMCGATVVGVATATFHDPRATLRIRDELKDFCSKTNVKKVSDLTGTLEM